MKPATTNAEILADDATYLLDLQVARLKKALRVHFNKECEEALGMKPGTFSKRVQRGVFPTKELNRLAAKRPELRLDVVWILSGVPAHTDATNTDAPATSRPTWLPAWSPEPEKRPQRRIPLGRSALLAHARRQALLVALRDR